MRVLSLDPGLANFGWCVLDRERDRTSVVAAGVISTPSGKDGMSRATSLAKKLQALALIYKPYLVVYEGPSLPPNAGSTWKIGLVYGVIVAFLEATGVHHERVSPIEVKKAVVKNWRAVRGKASRSTKGKKQQKDRVIAMVTAKHPEIRWPDKKTLHEHVADAVGVAYAGVAKWASLQAADTVR